MDPFAIPLLNLAQQRLSWTAERELVLARNVANIDTPGWQAKDIAPFAASLSAASAAPDLARTARGHMAGTAAPARGARAVSGTGRQPDGNAVSLDMELEKLAATDTAQQIAASVYHTYVGLFRTALGQG